MCSRAPLANRLRFWAKVVQPSLLWGLQTVRARNNDGLSSLRFCQKLQIRKMMKLKRHPMGDQVEPWLQWQIRTLHKAEAVAQQFHVAIEQKFHDQRLSWAGHLARFGVKSHVQHMAHFFYGDHFFGGGSSSSTSTLLMTYQLSIHKTGDNPGDTSMAGAWTG